MNIIQWAIARIKEPSTATAVGGFLAVVGISIDVTTLTEILMGLGALFGVLGIGMKEKPSEE